MINDRHEYEKMAAVESVHWWYQSLHQQVTAYLESHYSKSVRVLDAGCGTGGMLAYLRKAGYQNLQGFDLSADAVEFCGEQKLAVIKGNLTDVDQLYAGKQFDLIISNDTLYFFDPLVCHQVIGKMLDLLPAGGSLIINVPALDIFSGIHDISVAIGKRFTPEKLNAAIAGFPVSIISMRYWPFLLSPLILFSRLIQRARLKLDPHCEIKSDIDLPHPLVNKLLLWVCQFENKLLPTFFGSSLFLVVRKN